MTSPREWIAHLECGSRLVYESRSFAPKPGESVPCRRHGYCRVTEVGAERADPVGDHPRRTRPRTQRELVDYVRASPKQSLSTLRRHRFTLRLVHDAARSGHIAIDEHSGRVVVLAGSATESG